MESERQRDSYKRNRKIKKQTLLNYPNPNDTFTLNTDASENGLGAALTQGKNLIGLYSYKLKGAETRYTIMEKELLSIIKALSQFKNIIFNSKIIINTDNANITFLKDSNNSRVQRWRLILEEFDYSLTHIKGSENTAADHISRCYLLRSQKKDNFYYDIPKIKRLQDNDPYIQSILTTKSQQIRLHSRGIYTDEKDRILIPDEYAENLLEQLHIHLGHPGLHKLINSIRHYLAIKNCKTRIYELLKKFNCHVLHKIVYLVVAPSLFFQGVKMLISILMTWLN
ncbi:Retrovirus-related Pol polyprotein from transposon gypsy, partial [Nosema granulosis]